MTTCDVFPSKYGHILFLFKTLHTVCIRLSIYMRVNPIRGGRHLSIYMSFYVGGVPNVPPTLAMGQINVAPSE
jgi:hypothetical protein